MGITHANWPQRHLHRPEASVPSKPTDDTTLVTSSGAALDLDAIRGALSILPSAADSEFGE